MAEDRKTPKPASSGTARSSIQGEGDYVSGRRYQKDAKRFTENHDTESLARAAAPKDEAEQREMLEAEKKGKAKARTGKSPRR